MPLWYKALDCNGSASRILKVLGSKIENDNLGRFVPLIKLEQKPEKQFILYLGINSTEKGRLPPEVEILLKLPIPINAVPGAFDDQDIRSMVGTTIDVISFRRRIPYVALQQELGDPFGTSIDIDADGNAAERTRHHDQLLLWLSVVGTGSWSTFRSACHELGLSPDSGAARSLLRRLRLLGHVETTRDGTAWSVAPSVLTLTGRVQQNYQYVLCGQRDEQLLASLHQVAELSVVPQINGQGPSTICIETPDAETLLTTLATLADSPQINIVDSAAAKLTQVLPSITAWLDHLQEFPHIVPALYDLRRFEGEKFVEVTFGHESGLYEFWPMIGNDKTADRPQYTLYYDAPRDRWLRGDWYGLRYLARRADGERCPIQYEVDACRLAVPDVWRWPELYERSLVLSSGRLPVRQGPWLIYEMIPPGVLDQLEVKLDLQRD